MGGGGLTKKNSRNAVRGLNIRFRCFAVRCYTWNNLVNVPRNIYVYMKEDENHTEVPIYVRDKVIKCHVNVVIMVSTGNFAFNKQSNRKYFCPVSGDYNIVQYKHSCSFLYNLNLTSRIT